jgi:predicted Zn-dependent protease
VASYENPPVNHEVNVSGHSPLREFLSLSLWLALAVVTLVVAIFFGMRLLAPLVPFSWERRMADPVVAQFTKGSPEEPVGRQRQRQQWLQALADRLGPALAVPQGMPITVHWLPSRVPNAFATLGGHVFIHQGLIDQVNSENALAMVMAHEIAHVRHRDPIGALGGGVAVALSVGVLMGGTTTVSGDAAQAVSQLHFSRRQERAADQAALAALRTTYGHLGDAEAFFQKMLCTEHGGGLTPEFLRTHPDTQARVDAIVAARRVDTYAVKAMHALVQLPAFMREEDKGMPKPAKNRVLC